MDACRYSNYIFTFRELKTNEGFDEAIELGERLRLRRKSSINNLINLAECYIGLGQKKERNYY